MPAGRANAIMISKQFSERKIDMFESFNYAALERSLMDIIMEFEIKLGYSKQPLKLYYPAKSLCRLLECHSAALDSALAGFSDVSKLGEVKFVMEDGDRYCAAVPAEGVKYVHENCSDGGFLREFIATTLNCPGGIDDIMKVFERFGEAECRRIASDEFDYLIYFKNGAPDAYRYCIKLGHGHASYHRFVKEDYEEFGF